jgi:predicted ArsR family transcriptional regulator
MEIPRLSHSQRAILDLMKYQGEMTVPRLAGLLSLNVETVRDHVRRLIAEDLVRREGSVREGPGRPEIIYGLTADAEILFPRREAEMLQRLAEHLIGSGNQQLLHDFFDGWLDERRESALARVRHLEGRARLDEVAAVMSEFGFMAVVDEAPDGPRLRLCHCPIRGLVDATKIPCRAEIGFVKELLGETLIRERYIPAGDASCTYRAGSAVP